MANVLQKEQIAPPSRIRAATLGAALTVLVLAGGLIASFMISSATFQALSGRVPDSLTFTLAVLVFSASTLLSSALWGVGMAHLAQVPVSRRVAWAGIFGFVPITLLLIFGLQAAEPIVFRTNLPLHRVFMVLFVPSAGLIAATSSLAVGWALGWGRAAPALALRVGLTAALAFLAVNLAMEALGWQVGGPGAAERATMLTVLFVSNLGAALAGGAMLGMTLAQRH
ncbi:MAG TPA: hypothetical protein VFU22_22745 [Roseiflexaceae bacterium]|nr:hypothetical protein [Roseiflexaceae bacterium]